MSDIVGKYCFGLLVINIRDNVNDVECSYIWMDRALNLTILTEVGSICNVNYGNEMATKNRIAYVLPIIQIM